MLGGTEGCWEGWKGAWRYCEQGLNTNLSCRPGCYSCHQTVDAWTKVCWEETVLGGREGVLGGREGGVLGGRGAGGEGGVLGGREGGVLGGREGGVLGGSVNKA